MNDQEILGLWKSQDQKIEQVLAMNSKILKEQMSQKSKKALLGFKVEKITGIVFGLPYLILLGALLGFGFHVGTVYGNYFLTSIGIIFLVNLKVLADYIRHLVLSYQIDFSGAVAAIQKQLIELKFSMIRSVRYIGIQLPFYTTLHLDSSWFPSQANTVWIIIQILITGLFTFAAIWIFKNFKPENIGNKFVQKLLFIADVKGIDQSLTQMEELKIIKNTTL